MMKRFFFILLICSLSGCSGTIRKEIKTVNELKYKKVLVMPFIQGIESKHPLSYNIFTQELSSYPEIEIIAREEINEQFIKDLGITHMESYGPVDFSVTLEGSQRREKLADMYGVNAIIFGTITVAENQVSLHIQMLDVESGDLTLSFFKEAEFYNNKLDDAVSFVAKNSAQKVIEHIKSNWAGTRIYKYR